MLIPVGVEASGEVQHRNHQAFAKDLADPLVHEPADGRDVDLGVRPSPQEGLELDLASFALLGRALGGHYNGALRDAGPGFVQGWQLP